MKVKVKVEERGESGVGWCTFGDLTIPRPLDDDHQGSSTPRSPAHEAPHERNGVRRRLFLVPVGFWGGEA